MLTKETKSTQTLSGIQSRNNLDEVFAPKNNIVNKEKIEVSLCKNKVEVFIHPNLNYTTNITRWCNAILFFRIK